MKLVIGLGNIGKQYENTYHNAGFLAVDFLCKNFGVECKKQKCNALICECIIDGQKVVFAKPTTLMNNSGLAVVALRNQFKVDNKDILVIYDDIDIPLGSFRYRKTGSAGTHNGMRDIVQHITKDFPRVRIGTGKQNIDDLYSYVLSNINSSDKQLITESIENILPTINEFLKC